MLKKSRKLTIKTPCQLESIGGGDKIKYISIKFDDGKIEKIDTDISKFNHILISLKENLNIDILISKIKDQLKNKFISEEDILITRERHRQHLVHSSDHLKNFLEILSS